MGTQSQDLHYALADTPSVSHKRTQTHRSKKGKERKKRFDEKGKRLGPVTPITIENDDNAERENKHKKEESSTEHQ